MLLDLISEGIELALRERVLKVVDEFCYLSSVLSSDAGIDDDIGNRLK